MRRRLTREPFGSPTIMSFRLTIVIAVIACTQPALGYCGRGHRSPEQEYRESERVFVGRVMSEKATPESGGYYEGTTYLLAVGELLRGTPAKTTSIFSENSSGRFPMEVGKRYLIFAYEEQGRLMVDSCGNSGELSKKGAVLDVVRSLAHQAPNPPSPPTPKEGRG